MLNLHGNFWGEPMHRTVKVGLKGDPVVVDMGQSLFFVGNYLIGAKGFGIHRNYLLEPNTEGEHLETTAIGESGAFPVHKGP